MFITPCVSRDTCHMSRVTCQVSGVTCQVSHVTSNSQTVRARELTFLGKVHLLPRVTCNMSHVTCHMSQSGEAIRWRVCYQRGRPRLVDTTYYTFYLQSPYTEVKIWRKTGNILRKIWKKYNSAEFQNLPFPNLVHSSTQYAKQQSLGSLADPAKPGAALQIQL